MEGFAAATDVLGNDSAYSHLRFFHVLIEINLSHKDNILNMILAPVASSHAATSDEAIRAYSQALEICRFLQSRMVDSEGCLLSIVTPSQFHKLENIFCTSANLVQLIDGEGSLNALNDYFTAIELAIRPPAPCAESYRYTYRDLVFAVYIAGISMSSRDVTTSSAILRELADSGGSIDLGGISEPGFNLPRAVHASADRLEIALYREGLGVMPTLILYPDEVLRLPTFLFPESLGVLPVICKPDASGTYIEYSDQATRQQTNSMTSAILISLAKRFQSGMSGTNISGRNGGLLRVSASLVLLLYYLALALSPSPSLYNNVGVLLSGLPLTRSARSGCRLVSGQELAKMYFEMGLQLDPTHPHLLTNYGSMMKDQGRTAEAIQSVQRVLSCTKTS